MQHFEHIVADIGRHLSSSDERQPNFVFFRPVNNARFHRFPVGKILRHLNITTSIGEAVKTFWTEFSKFYRKGLFFQKKRKKLLTKFPVLATSRRHISAMITDCPKLTTKIALYGMSSFHFTVKINYVSPLECTPRTRNVLPTLLATSDVRYWINQVRRCFSTNISLYLRKRCKIWT